MNTNIIIFIKEQSEILEPKLLFGGPVTHCALTDFIISIIGESNKLTPFKYRLIMEDDESNDTSQF